MNSLRLLADRYEPFEAIGHGADGTVFRGHDTVLNIPVALKVIGSFDELGLDSARFEISISNKLFSHENITPVLDAFVETTPGLRYTVLVFELMDSDLHNYISEGPSFIPLPFVWKFMYELVSALRHCHSRCVIHRDVKPHNILVNEQMKSKLNDFGCGFIFCEGIEYDGLEPGMGTLAFRAPEMLLQDACYREKIDMWAAGCVFAQLISGSQLFNGCNEIDQLHQIFNKLGFPNEDTWPGIEEILTEEDFGPPQRTVPFGQDHRRVGGDGIDLLKKMLTLDPEKRIGAAEALQHPYFSDFPPAMMEGYRDFFTDFDWINTDDE